MDNDDNSDLEMDPLPSGREDPSMRFRLYPITWVMVSVVLGIGLFHTLTFDPDRVRIPFGEEWVSVVGGDARDILVEEVATLCVLGPGQDHRALPEDPPGARGGSPSKVDDNRLRLIALDADGRFLVEAERRRTGRAPTLDAVDAPWCAAVGRLVVEEYAGVDGFGEGATLRLAP
jgi:hypothetical protein